MIATDGKRSCAGADRGDRIATRAIVPAPLTRRSQRAESDHAAIAGAAIASMPASPWSWPLLRGRTNDAIRGDRRGIAGLQVTAQVRCYRREQSHSGRMSRRTCVQRSSGSKRHARPLDRSQVRDPHATYAARIDRHGAECRNQAIDRHDKDVVLDPLHTAGPNETQHAQRAAPAPAASPASQPHRLLPNTHDVSVLVGPGLGLNRRKCHAGRRDATESMSPRPGQRKA